jgi:hypothetical protein
MTESLCVRQFHDGLFSVLAAFYKMGNRRLDYLIDDTLHQQIDAIGLRLMDQLKEYHHEDFTETWVCC